MRNKICSVICGAPSQRLPKEKIEGLVIAADRGLKYALESGITPDLAVGDFDSFSESVPSGIECVRVSPIKDETDAQLAADIAEERGCTELRFFAALGGRLDHTFANIQMIYGLKKRGIRCELYGDSERAFLLSGETAELPRFEGYLSVFAFGGSAVVSERGTKYPLDRHTLDEVFPLGVSNEITSDIAQITVHSGTVLVIEHYGRD